MDNSVPFKQAFEKINIYCGILFNAFLLYLIVRFSRPSLGTYKYLLFVFASYDIFISIVHAVIDHQMLIVNSAFVAVANSFAESRHLTAFYCASYTVPFLLTIINFLYRFWAVRCPIRIRLFTNPFFVVLLILACFSGAALWYCAVFFGMTGQEEEIAKDEAREEYRRRYHQTIIEGYVISDHWRNGTFNVRQSLVLLFFDTVIVGCISIATVLAVLTLYSIRAAEQMSGHARYLQGRLLMALCAQTAVPLLCVYIPFFLALTCPFLGLSDYGLTDSMAVLHSLFPSLDALVIVALMTDYRRGVTGMMRRVTDKRQTTIETLNGSVTTSSMSLSQTTSPTHLVTMAPTRSL